MEPNPRVPDFLRAVTWVECAVVGGAAALLLTVPKWGGQDVWAWITPPFNARYVGAIYLGALVPLLIFAATARWSPGRIVLWMIFVFTTVIGVVMLAYAGRFEWARFATWVFGRVPQVNQPRERKIDLPRPVPVYLTYLTVEATPDGVVFRPDRYGRDEKLLARVILDADNQQVAAQ